MFHKRVIQIFPTLSAVLPLHSNNAKRMRIAAITIICLWRERPTQIGTGQPKRYGNQPVTLVIRKSTCANLYVEKSVHASLCVVAAQLQKFSVFKVRITADWSHAFIHHRHFEHVNGSFPI